jgi:hypothetical protein
MSNEDVFDGNGIQIELKDEKSFLVVVETLTRIGVASKKDKTLYQSCHILHKKGKYAILHFKELFILDGKTSDIDEGDYARRNAIVKLLEQWNLLKIVDSEEPTSDAEEMPINQIKVISHKEKPEWKLIAKYTISGHKKKK